MKSGTAYLGYSSQPGEERTSSPLILIGTECRSANLSTDNPSIRSGDVRSRSLACWWRCPLCGCGPRPCLTGKPRLLGNFSDRLVSQISSRDWAAFCCFEVLQTHPGPIARRTGADAQSKQQVAPIMGVPTFRYPRISPHLTNCLTRIPRHESLKTSFRG